MAKPDRPRKRFWLLDETMSLLSVIFSAAEMLLSFSDVWLWIIIGTLIGVWIGAIPGVSAVTALSVLLIPSTYLEPIVGIAFLTAIYCGSLMGGSISATLLNVPGTPGAVATCFDAFPMTKRGEHHEALGLSLISSTFGCLISWILVLCMFGPITGIVLKFGPAEMLMVVVFALTMMGVAGVGMRKTLIGATFGMLLAAVGSSAYGYARANLGMAALIEGINSVPFIIGMFAVSELFFILEKNTIVEGGKVAKKGIKASAKGVLHGFQLFFSHKITMIRSAIVGMLVGLLPAAGSSVASVVCYGLAQNSSKEPETYGKGNPDGIVAAETANNAAEGGAIAVLMAFGIPGSGAAAILMSSFIMLGLTPGPSLIRDNAEFAYAVILVNIITGFLLLAVGFLFVLFFSGVVNVPPRILVPIVVLFTFFGSASVRGFTLECVLMVIFGAVGYFYRKGGYPVLSLVLGFILGSMLEGNLVRTLLLYQSNYLGVFSSKIVVFLIVCTVLMFFWPKAKKAFEMRRAEKNRKQ